ncbi:F-box only protein 21-like [Vanessa atalanta]|uniref:F-box only protein 21-like n=1 Tax=Vanessa atalanta TaxID=42275 RepID=UPI001FCDDF5D|nr:F-box only protein 21-like [Vanessa atalanta]XP_047528306.1 F-box only protein 21-like [Vanessa atalanta]
MENIKINTSLASLPDEIISLILSNIEPRDIIRFSVTCRRFYEIVINNDYLWKIKYSEMLPKEIVTVVEENDCIWLREMIQYYKLKRKIFIELVSMSPKSFWRVYEVSIEDVRSFFAFATETNLSFYYTVHILQGIVKKGTKILDALTIVKPLYTLTVMYYTKIVLRHLIQTYLAIKWVKLHMKNMLTPEVVITFFLQWIDPINIYTDEEVEIKIQGLVAKVENVLKEVYSNNSNEKEDFKYSDKEVLLALTQVIYKDEKFSVCANTKVKTLNLAKVIEESNGNIITYAVIYHAVAKRLGVKCDLIAFPNHLFLEWQNNEDPSTPLFTIDLITGSVNPKRRCPFSQSASSEYEYVPDSLLQYIYSSYMKSKGAIRDCKTQNAIHLLDFLGTRHINNNPYKNFFTYLIEHSDTPVMDTPLNMTYIHDVHLQMLVALANLNPAPEVAYHTVSVKKHRSYVTFAVGMICYHKVYNYMCIILGWELDGSHLRIPTEDNLGLGRDQPFYRVIAGDQSERYVAQENLMAVTTPFRIHRLEDHIAREFTHFDGFSYVPNNEKILEYPKEQLITEVFRKRFVNVAIP